MVLVARGWMLAGRSPLVRTIDISLTRCIERNETLQDGERRLAPMPRSFVTWYDCLAPVVACFERCQAFKR